MQCAIKENIKCIEYLVTERKAGLELTDGNQEMSDSDKVEKYTNKCDNFHGHDNIEWKYSSYVCCQE